MKIAVISDLFYPHVGGGEYYLMNIEKQLVEQGHDVIHLTSRLAGSKANETVDGINVIRSWIPFSNNVMKGRFFFPFTNLTKIKELRDADIIQSVTYPAAVTGWLFGKLLKKPNILFCHEFFRDYWKFMRSNILAKKIYPVVENFIADSPYDWAITPSEYSKRSLIDAGFDKRKISVAYHGIDEKFRPNIEVGSLRKKYNLVGKKTFGFIGRMDDFGQKGIKYLIEAAKLVVNEVPNARLLLAGTGYNNVKPLIKKLGIEKFVINFGKIPDNMVPKFYSLLDVFSGASIAEGFGLVYAEASRCGRPVVATNTSSIPEIVINKKTGLLVPSRNSESLANAIIKLLNNKKLAKKFGKNGPKYTKKFTWENSLKKHIEVYEKFVE